MEDVRATAAAKPGYMTTEFWLTAVHQVISVALLLHFVPAADATAIDASLSQLIPAIFIVLAQGYGLVTYVKGRAAGKVVAPPVVAPVAPAPAPVLPVINNSDVVVNTGDGKLLK